MTKIERIQELVRELNMCRDAYYNENNPYMSDSEYDTMFDELKQLEQEVQYTQSDSPTQTVGYTVISKLQKVQHFIPLKSLNETKNVEKLLNWTKEKDVLLMAKADGLTVELDFDNGELIQASTRGDGNIGEDITHNAKTFIGLPLKIPFMSKLKIVGEALIHKKDFDMINSKLTDDQKYKTPRNLVAGSVRQLDNKICSEREVYFYAFNILECSRELSDSKNQRLSWLGFLGFYTILSTKTRVFSNIEGLTNHIEILKDLSAVHSLPIDGLVATFDSVEYSNSLGETSHHPLHSLAFKFEDETAETILRDIEWSLGRTGVITPVAIFDTVELDGTKVSRASLHNLSIIENLELGLLDRISVQKCNMIIPQIQENFTRSNTLEIPEKCPECGGITIIEQQNDSKVLYCTNPNCSAKLLGKMVHFVSRAAMNIDGFSEATLEKFIEKGWIIEFADIYNLEQYKSEIIKMDGFGAKSYKKLIDAIEKSKDVKMENFLYAMGIPLIGRSASKTISKYFDGDLNKFLDISMDIAVFNKYFDFTQLENFGSTMNDSIISWIMNYDKMQECLSVAGNLIFIKDEPKIANEMKDLSGSPFYEKNVYCTGSFANYKKDELKSILEGLGANFTSGYAKSLDYLIVGSLKGSGKEDKARKDGVPILSEDKFLEMIKS